MDFAGPRDARESESVLRGIAGDVGDVTEYCDSDAMEGKRILPPLEGPACAGTEVSMGGSLGEGMSSSKSSSSLAYANPPYSESESDGGEGGRAAGTGSRLSEGGCCALNFSKNGSRGVVGVVADIGTAGSGTLGGSRGGGT